MNFTNGNFGIGCIKNIYSFLDIKMPRKILLREETLYKNIINMSNANSISANQKIWLTDRYLTYQYLDKINYGNFNLLKKQILEDINNINKAEKFEDLTTSKKIQLNQAYNLYKKVIKFQKGIDNIKKGNFTDKESIKLLILSVSFIFNMQRNKNQYERNSFKAMQYIFWQTVIEIGGKYADFDISAGLLQHSLEKEPNDLLIAEGKIVDEIIHDDNFKNNVNNIIKKYGINSNAFTFDSKIDDNFSMRFSENDLYYSLNNVSLHIIGTNNAETWNLEVKIHDRYDYSKRKTLLEHYNDVNSVSKSIFSSTLYNLAYYSIKFGVMKEYDIDIEFKINENFEVIKQ